MLFWQCSNIIIYAKIVGKISDQNLNVCLFSNPGGRGQNKGWVVKKVCKKTHWCLGLQQQPQIKGGRRERRRRKKRLYTICGQFLYNLHILKCTILNEKQYELKDMNLIYNGNIKEKYIFYIHARKKETPPSEFYR